jgi:peptide methionine sulfoxide reductase msrA/msrB
MFQNRANRVRALWWRVALGPMVSLTVGLLVGCVNRPASGGYERTGTVQESRQSSVMGHGPAREHEAMSQKTYAKPPDAELRQRLSPLEYEVTQRSATEPPFNNRYWNHHEPGLYVDVVTGEPLFSSRDKFDSGTGWPSFSRPLDPKRIVERTDRTHGMLRTEVRSKDGDSHLGHVFEDGPAPTGLRYCLNSAALRFIPVDRLGAEGYGQYRSLFEGTAKPTNANEQKSAAQNSCTAPGPGDEPGCSPTLETAILAGGCFWGMQDILRKIPGVLETTVGYTGGSTSKPSYGQVSTGETGHAEAVRVVFDPARLSYEDLLEKWFFRMHDPTTRNRQGNDVGSQYRSAIFVTSPEQRRIAEEVRHRVDASGKWSRPVVTEIRDAGPFTVAEEHHQDYLAKHPDGYTCHYLRE